MCGIWGSFHVAKFEILDKVNQSRGNYASGILYSNGESYDYHKTSGNFDWNERNLPDGFIYLGHNQAPTSSERVYREHNSHPFEAGDWVVAHNGVLTNFETLKKKYLPEHEGVVDSSIIPALLNHFQKHRGSIIKNVATVLELLEGTFGLWIFNSKTSDIFLARQGSTLFYDNNSFSSVKGKGFEDIKEGLIYKFDEKGTKEVGKFKVNSPFFVI
jgi:glucosamine 6-phosphate synthetase-like amidotransferase/phosphosugar isomerase protein